MEESKSVYSVGMVWYGFVSLPLPFAGALTLTLVPIFHSFLISPLLLKNLSSLVHGSLSSQISNTSSQRSEKPRSYIH